METEVSFPYTKKKKKETHRITYEVYVFGIHTILIPHDYWIIHSWKMGEVREKNVSPRDLQPPQLETVSHR